MESMTGFGEGKAETSRHELTVSVRSVNHRFLDMSIRVPEELRRFQREVTDLVRSRIARGRVDLRIESAAIGEGTQQVHLRSDLLRSYRDAIAAAQQEGLLAGEPSPGEILRLPEVIQILSVDQEAEDEIREALQKAVEDGLETLVSSRREEGARLQQALSETLTGLKREVAELDGIRAELESLLAERLQARLQRLLGGVEIEGDRLAMEIAILSEKGDIQEELDRLRSHLDSFRDLLRATGPVGKKMEFLCQEILRELNTVGSKCRETMAVDRVLEGKVACEKLREQVQNIQ